MEYQRGAYDPKSALPFRLSRSKVDLFAECPRCFYFDRRLGLPRPSGPGFSLNVAVDELLKKEFDLYRQKGEAHPLMKKYELNAIPVNHEELDEWRSNFRGVRFLHRPTNLELFGAIDDLWQNSQGEYIVVDYKATSTVKEISLEDEYKQSYKKQAEFYQWLLQQRGFKVSTTAYFVFCNGLKDRDLFDSKLEFELSIISYIGNNFWVEPMVKSIYNCLKSDKIPKKSDNCQYCRFVDGSKSN